MIQNLVVNGCSFTNDQYHDSWATLLSQDLNVDSYHNLAADAAGNQYICSSTINFLEQKKFNPAETMVIIMWTENAKKDLNITGEWWYYLKDDYWWRRNDTDGNYYIFSGGIRAAWTKNKTTKKIFEWLYKLSDPTTICFESLLNFINLENYLKINGYRYKFTNWGNSRDPDAESNFGGDYSIGHFCKTMPIYQNYDFSNWVFSNDRFDGMGEFSKNMNELDSTGHPTPIAHKKFTKEIILPAIQNIIN